MSVLERLNIDLVGAAGRGGSFRTALEANGARVHAVCDSQADRLEECAAWWIWTTLPCLPQP